MKQIMRIPNKTPKAAVGLSGGVDSSVAAALLQQSGYDVCGLTMKIFDDSFALQEGEKHGCFGPGERDDVEAAEAVCNKLGIPFHVIDLRKEYRKHVIDYFRSEYLAGKTPNPCIVCNQRVKFGFMLQRAKKAGVDFDFFATGHYARITRSGEHFQLKKAVDRSKDQSYFLYGLLREQLSQTLFPIGNYTKQQVRKLAASFGLETANRRESQDFIAGGDYSVLFNPEEIRAGDIVDENGTVLGRHRGIIHYTVGQRRGLGIASHRPLYVSDIDVEHNTVVVSDREKIFFRGLIADKLNLLTIDGLDRPHELKVKINLRHREAAATVFPLEGDRAKIIFKSPQRAVTPGQSAVFYSNDTVFGGGIIETAI